MFIHRCKEKRYKAETSTIDTTKAAVRMMETQENATVEAESLKRPFYLGG